MYTKASTSSLSSLPATKMAKVRICNAVVQGNPSTFLSKLEFEITFECLEGLAEDLQWKIIYVGSAESEGYDQVLDTVYVGPVPEGHHKFVFSADPPNPEKIPDSDIVGATILLITCSYHDQEFIRIGYYVNNDYEDPDLQAEAYLRSTPSSPGIVVKLIILLDSWLQDTLFLYIKNFSVALTVPKIIIYEGSD